MEIKRSELIDLYNENELKNVCFKLKITKPTLYAILKENNIPLKGRAKKNLKILKD